MEPLSVEPAESGAEAAETRRWRNWFSHHIGLDVGQKLEVYRSVAASTSMRDATYWAEIAFAAGIATLGLTLDSPAVIIGAMLISPLMGPILAAGLALAAGDFILALRASTNIVASCTAAIVLSALLVTFLPFRDMTQEIATRTHPNTLDLLIALFSGAVGAIAVSKSARGIATAVPGVAIAVALMPPLCVTGYGIGLLLTVDRETGLDVVRGGSLLFVTNLIAITFSSMLVFAALNIDAVEVRQRIRDVRSDAADALRPLFRGRDFPKELQRIGSLPARILMVGALMALVFMPLKRSFDALQTEIRHRQQLNEIQKSANRVWDALFARAATGERRSYIDSVEPHEEGGTLHVALRVFTSRALTPDERSTYVRDLAAALGRDSSRVSLSLVEIPTSRYEVATRSKEPPPKEPPPSPAAQLRTGGQTALAAVSAAAVPSSASLLDTFFVVRGDTTEVVVTYLSAAELSADARELIARDIRTRLGSDAVKVSFEFVPSAADVRFRSGKPDGAGAQTIDALARVLGRFPLAVELSAGRDRIPARNVAALRARLVAAGVDEAAISVAETGGGPSDLVHAAVQRR